MEAKRQTTTEKKSKKLFIKVKLFCIVYDPMYNVRTVFVLVFPSVYYYCVHHTIFFVFLFISSSSVLYLFFNGSKCSNPDRRKVFIHFACTILCSACAVRLFAWIMCVFLLFCIIFIHNLSLATIYDGKLYSVNTYAPTTIKQIEIKIKSTHYCLLY